MQNLYNIATRDTVTTVSIKKYPELSLAVESATFKRMSDFYIGNIADAEKLYARLPESLEKEFGIIATYADGELFFANEHISADSIKLPEITNTVNARLTLLLEFLGAVEEKLLGISTEQELTLTNAQQQGFEIVFDRNNKCVELSHPLIAEGHKQKFNYTGEIGLFSISDMVKIKEVISYAQVLAAEAAAREMAAEIDAFMPKPAKAEPEPPVVLAIKPSAPRFAASPIIVIPAIEWSPKAKREIADPVRRQILDNAAIRLTSKGTPLNNCGFIEIGEEFAVQYAGNDQNAVRKILTENGLYPDGKAEEKITVRGFANLVALHELGATLPNSEFLQGISSGEVSFSTLRYILPESADKLCRGLEDLMKRPEQTPILLIPKPDAQVEIKSWLAKIAKISSASQKVMGEARVEIIGIIKVALEHNGDKRTPAEAIRELASKPGNTKTIPREAVEYLADGRKKPHEISGRFVKALMDMVHNAYKTPDAPKSDIYNANASLLRMHTEFHNQALEMSQGKLR